MKRRRDDLPSIKSLTHMIQMDWETGRHRPGPRYRLLLSAIHDADERQIFDDGDSDREALAMAYAKTGLRREKRDLRDRMRALGLDHRQIAAEFSRSYGLRPRAAWREAYGWSLLEAAERINSYRGNTGLDHGGFSGMTAAHLSEYENWPGNSDHATGRKPSPYLLAVLGEIYGCHVTELIDLADRAHLPAADLLVLDTYTQPSTPVAQASAIQEITVRVPNLILRRIREEERHETRGEFAEALTRTAREMGEAVEPSERHVARLEDGDIRYPHPAYRRVLVALCGRPMAELGFSRGDQPEYLHDGRSDETKALSAPAAALFGDPSAAETLLSSGTLLAANASGPQAITEEVSSTLRRDFVTLGAFAGHTVASQIFGKLENELDLIHMALDRGTTSEERTSYLEGVASDLSVQVVKVAPLAVLQPTLKSLNSIRGLLEQRQPTRYQVRLVRISAELCTIVGEIMFNIGQFQKARDWYITAEHAAHDIGDRYLADIALAGQAYLPTYSDDPNGVLALTGPRLESNPSPSPAIAWLWGFRARAHATLKQPSEFKHSIERARQCLERSPADLVKPGIFSFVPEKLAFYEATGAVRLNDTDSALNAADRALSMYDLSETTEPTLAKLERASALAKGGEVPEACRVAKAALLDSRTYHGVTVRAYARRFDDLIRGIELPETREWREVRAEVHGQHDASAG